MAFRDYGESKNIKIPEEQEKIMDIMCEAWEQCLNRCDCVDNCPDRAGQNMRLAMCMALKQSRLTKRIGRAAKITIPEIPLSPAWCTYSTTKHMCRRDMS